MKHNSQCSRKSASKLRKITQFIRLHCYGLFPYQGKVSSCTTQINNNTYAQRIVGIQVGKRNLMKINIWTISACNKPYLKFHNKLISLTLCISIGDSLPAYCWLKQHTSCYFCCLGITSLGILL